MLRKGYNEYIGSAQWAKKRDARKKIDSNRCQTCHRDGSAYRLEVHHATYKRLFDEDVENDLITLCVRCHDAITSVTRKGRYEDRDICVDNSDLVLDLDLVLPERGKEDESKNFKSDPYVSLSPHIAQQPASEPNE